jgi:hypothetical protein
VTLRPYKFLVMPVVQKIDEHGVVVAEGQGEQPDVVFGVDGLRRYADGFEQTLAELEASTNGAGNSNVLVP